MLHDSDHVLSSALTTEYFKSHLVHSLLGIPRKLGWSLILLLYYRSLTVRADITQLVKGLPKSEASHPSTCKTGRQEDQKFHIRLKSAWAAWDPWSGGGEEWERTGEIEIWNLHYTEGVAKRCWIKVKEKWSEVLVPHSCSRGTPSIPPCSCSISSQLIFSSVIAFPMWKIGCQNPFSNWHKMLHYLEVAL